VNFLNSFPGVHKGFRDQFFSDGSVINGILQVVQLSVFSDEQKTVYAVKFLLFIFLVCFVIFTMMLNIRKRYERFH
jgi:hypothetical protein